MIFIITSFIFNIIKRSYKNTCDEFTLLNISYIDPVKGHIFIFNTLKQLIAKGIVNIKLRIGGYGYFESELKKFVDENNLGKYISFIGPLKYGSIEMITELKNADALIHPSVLTKDDKEGIPGAIVEAMFTGLPIISTYHGGIPYIIENNKTGILVKEWDIHGLSNAILNLMDSESYRELLGKSGQKYALDNLDLKDKEIELERIYLKLINKLDS